MASRLTLLLLALALTFAGCSNDSTNSHHAYLAIPQANHIAGFEIDNESGKLSAMSGSPFAAGTSPTAMCISPSNQSLYVVNSGENTVSLFTIDSKGLLTEVTPRAVTGTNPVAVAVNAAGTLLFVANQDSNTISVFAIGGNGKLTEVLG